MMILLSLAQFCMVPLWYILTYIYQLWCHSYKKNAVQFEVHILLKVSAKSPNVLLLPMGFPSATTRARPSTTKHEFRSIVTWVGHRMSLVKTSAMTDMFSPHISPVVQGQNEHASIHAMVCSRKATTRPVSYATINHNKVLWSALIVTSLSQDYKRFSSMYRCSTHNLCSEMT